MREFITGMSVRFGSRLKTIALAAIIILNAACDSGSSGVTTTLEPDIGEAIDQSGAAGGTLNSSLRTGVFFDSPVANIGFRTESVEGKTNQNGEFNFRQGEQVTFTIGDIELPSITAKDVITPLDIFRTSVVTNTEVINLSRLLQTLDIDNNPENGITLPENIERFGAGTSIPFYNSEIFDDSISNALVEGGIESPLVDSGIAATHLSNSLLTRGLIEVAQIDPSLASVEAQQLRRLPDLDNDSIADTFDLDDDGDEVADLLDIFPQDSSEHLDSDADGIGDNADEDDDNDGTSDQFDQYPYDQAEQLDSDNDGIGNNADYDDDNDGALDTVDQFPLDPTEQLDADLDGIGNNADSDDDNDGTLDTDDRFPINPNEQLDSDEDGSGNFTDDDDDNDGTPDYMDEFPLDPTEQIDTDSDGIGNNGDDDDDNDGTLDADDNFPLNPAEQSDADNDGVGDNADLDDDNDGIPDYLDQYPKDPAEQLDSDSDGIGNNADNDDDNDGTLDIDDALPLDPNETSDIDNDGIGDNSDDDNDNDGTVDLLDAFPLDPTEIADADEDGIGDNADSDDDNDDVPDDEDAFPFDASESADSDNDGIGDSVDFDRDNDGVDDIDDAFPDDPNEQQDTDADGYGDNEDPDDDNDGVWDTIDALPKNPTETQDTDRDGIGNNADEDDDNDGVADADDFAPLYRSCSTEAHSTSEFCDVQFVVDIAYIENMGDSMFLFNRYTPTAYRVQLSTGEALPQIDMSSFTVPGDLITAVKYHHDHERLYVALSSGVILYFTPDSNDATYFYTAPERINGLQEVGHLLLASQYIYGEDYTTNVLKASGHLLNTNRSSLADLNESAWNSTEEHIYIFESYNGLERRAINLETGEIGFDTHGTYYLTPGAFIKAPFIFSPDDSLLVSVDGKTYYSDGAELVEDGVISSDELSDLMWTSNEGLVTTQTTGFDTIVEHRNAELTTIDTQLLAGEPLELLHNDGTFYIITSSPLIGVLINAYTPSEEGTSTLNVFAPQPDENLSGVDAQDPETVDFDGNGIVDSADLEYIGLKNSVQGNWETDCAVVYGSNGLLYAIHGLAIRDPEIRSVLTFFTDSVCQSPMSPHLPSAAALHRSIASYDGIVESTSGLPAMELTFSITDGLNSPPFPIHFYRNQIFAIEDSMLYFGTVGMTNVESLKLDIDRPFHKVESFRQASLFESIEQSVITGYSTSHDSDRDGVIDRDDRFPNNPYEYADADNDGIGDNADSDDDNDGISDLQDLSPFGQ